MSKRKITHIGFSDESNWNKGRFRSIGLATCHVDSHSPIEEELQGLLEESGISKFKWSELDGARKRFAACKSLKFVVDNSCNRLRRIHQQNQATFSESSHANCLRVDVLIWDTNDSRHNIMGRDDIGNLQRMYYHLFRNVMWKRWPKDAVWKFHPDKNTAIQWSTIQECLDAKSSKIFGKHTEEGFKIQFLREFDIEEIQPILENDPLLIMVADIFTGMAAFSWEKFKDYERWTSKCQKCLVQDEETEASFSNRDKERFKVLQYFDSICKKSNLGVSLRSTGGLQTKDPAKSLNFWLYKPQSTKDIAPKRR
ncbi:MAG: hypothetical protein MUO26_10000 [Methanotrichaceae archaeon]|nr:hypothetical protein [Methanotrichaceae archaeon]